MQHAITIGDLVVGGLAVAGTAVIVGALLYVIAAFGRGMSR